MGYAIYLSGHSLVPKESVRACGMWHLVDGPLVNNRHYRVRGVVKSFHLKKEFDLGRDVYCDGDQLIDLIRSLEKRNGKKFDDLLEEK